MSETTATETCALTIIKVMREIESISKDRFNKIQGYNFRGVDDIYNELHATMAKHGLITLPSIIWERSEEKANKSGGVNIYRILNIRYTFVNQYGESLSCDMIGEGMDNGDKASNKAQSVAHKYALLQVFMIPTGDLKDPENDSHEIVAKPITPQHKPLTTQPAPQPKPQLTPQAQIRKEKLDQLMRDTITVRLTAEMVEGIVGKDINTATNDQLKALHDLVEELKANPKKEG